MNNEQMIQLFNLESEKYERITGLVGKHPGFSVQIKYPEDIRYQPPRNKEGEPDTVALLHVVALPEKQVEGLIPIYMTVSRHSRYLSNHYDYNFDDDSCPTEESVENSRNSRPPVELNADDEFYVDVKNNKLIDRQKRDMSGVDIVNGLYQKHLDTIHWFRGLRLQLKLQSRSVLATVLSWMVMASKWCLRYLFGRYLEDKETIAHLFKGYDSSALKKLSTESLIIANYKASKHVIILFCFIAMLAYTLFYFLDISSGYLSKLFSNNFLSIAFSVIVLFVLDSVVPLVVFHLMNMIIRVKYRVMMMKFKF